MSIQSMMHSYTHTQHSCKRVITLLNQPRVVFSSLPADGKLMDSSVF